ncbi:hypothetical protein BDM02DRAFT_2734166 [Thelephora ganbajun]|uniref:Uncharacterized protein n=1 Tax=Thelephora ganbajun TaxID=370292 RepID=A0ACB6ZC36_THEGA|nr:hypothetical protein BDM02DRAFT_2734166 [Thelephora ganbajun]
MNPNPLTHRMHFQKPQVHYNRLFCEGEKNRPGSPRFFPRFVGNTVGTGVFSRSENTGKNTWETLSILRIFSYGKWSEKQIYTALDCCQKIFLDNAKYSTA